VESENYTTISKTGCPRYSVLYYYLQDGGGAGVAIAANPLPV